MGALPKRTTVNHRQRCGWAAGAEDALGLGPWASGLSRARSRRRCRSRQRDVWAALTPWPLGLSSLGRTRRMPTGCRAPIGAKPKSSMEGDHPTEVSWASGAVPEASTNHSWWVLCSSSKLRGCSASGPTPERGGRELRTQVSPTPATFSHDITEPCHTGCLEGTCRRPAPLVRQSVPKIEAFVPTRGPGTRP